MTSESAAGESAATRSKTGGAIERRPTFSMAESEELSQYRRPSGAAFVGFLIALASPLALLDPIVWAVPLFAALICLLGLRATRRPTSEDRAALEPPRTGRLFAILGLLFAATFIGWAPTRHFSRLAILKRQSLEFAQYFLETVQARQLKEAHQLTRAPGDRRPRGISLEDAYIVEPKDSTVAPEGEEFQMMTLDVDPLVMLERFVTQYPMKELLDRAQRKELVLAWKDSAADATSPSQTVSSQTVSSQPVSRLTFDRFDKVEHLGGGMDNVTLIFRWDTTEDGQVRTRPLTLVVRRNELDDKLVVWQEISIKAPE